MGRIHKEHIPQTQTQPGTSSIDSSMFDTSSRKRQNVAQITTLSLPVLPISAMNPQDEPDSSREWDHLLRWEHESGEIVDIEDMGAEEEYICDEEQNEVGEGIEEDQQDGNGEHEEVHDRSKLNPDQIVDIINERIEYFTSTWVLNKGVEKGDEVDDDPESLWEKAEAAGQREALVQRHETDVAYFKQRLDTLCTEIAKFPGKTVEKVRHQCGNLEVTVNSLELAEWLLSIYRLEPVDDSEDIVEQSTSQGSDVEYGHARLAANHDLEIRTDIIDLGSPSDSSGDEMVVDNSPPSNSNDLPASSLPHRFHTPDSVPAESIEPPVNHPIQSLPNDDQLQPTNHPLRSPPIARTAPLQPSAQLSDEPEKASIASARRWKWADLVDTQDRKRAVTKALQEMKWDDREIIRDRLRVIGKVYMIREIPACIRMLGKGETKMPGVLARDVTKIVIFTRLFLCWWLCDNYFRAEPSKWHLEELEECLKKGCPDPSTFCDYLDTIMATTFSEEALKHPDRPSQAEVIEISDDDEPPFLSASLSRKKSQQSRTSLATAIVID
ncbi:hypothetical protein GQ44DRAFT_708175 [Phaeosphaeriaceae sp. PMI808]|nr:hypothetical protein GQ44DRAFT_708175 [Phaeosphaeriaceae sp. PMI808]